MSMIFFVAPFSGMATEASSFLAATKKINYILQILTDLGYRVVLLNTMPSFSKKSSVEIKKHYLGNGKSIDIVTPYTSFSSKIGYFINLFKAKLIVKTLINNYGIPEYIWAYNSYSIEMKIGGFLKNFYGAKFILEFEDWHYGRLSLYNPKSTLDWCFWISKKKYIDYGFAVNNFLLEKFLSNNINCELLPGIVDESLLSISSNHIPFLTSDYINVGYFGGLTSDKGADFILNLIDECINSNIKVRFTISGKGYYEDAFRLKAINYPKYIYFNGAVSDSELMKLISSVDVIINPHDINYGIFPFKVLEAVVSGRLLISTKLNLSLENLESLSNSVIFCNKNISDFISEIKNAKTSYFERKDFIKLASIKYYDLYSYESIKSRIQITLSKLK